VVVVFLILRINLIVLQKLTSVDGKIQRRSLPRMLNLPGFHVGARRSTLSRQKSCIHDFASLQHPDEQILSQVSTMGWTEWVNTASNQPSSPSTDWNFEHWWSPSRNNECIPIPFGRGGAPTQRSAFLYCTSRLHVECGNYWMPSNMQIYPAVW